MRFDMTHTGATTPGGAEMNLNMELYDANGTVLRSNFVANGDESLSYVSHTGGTYYLKVYWAAYPDGAPNGVALNYALDVDLPQKTWATTLDFGPARNASVALYDIDNDGRDEIFVGTSKALDAEQNEVRPAGLIVLEDNGAVKWSQTFAAHAGPDPVTGKIYQTTSVTTAPVFSDIDHDGDIDMVVGLGADSREEGSAAGQPGDSGGVAALDGQGNLLWRFTTNDSFGNDSSGPDGRPDGVYGAPRIFDIDADGQVEVIFTSWDHYFYVLDGRNGAVELKFDLHDTAGATPAVADLDGDGIYELVVPADITNNDAAGLPDQGGILHVLNNYAQPIVPGWTDQVATTTEADFRGKFEPQSLWSSPQIVDLDRDGRPEIVQGTGNFFQDDRGQYVKVWNADGSLRFQFDTDGRVLASPLIADLDGDRTPKSSWPPWRGVSMASRPAARCCSTPRSISIPTGSMPPAPACRSPAARSRWISTIPMAIWRSCCPLAPRRWCSIPTAPRSTAARRWNISSTPMPARRRPATSTTTTCSTSSPAAPPAAPIRPWSIAGRT